MKNGSGLQVSLMLIYDPHVSINNKIGENAMHGCMFNHRETDNGWLCAEDHLIYILFEYFSAVKEPDVCIMSSSGRVKFSDRSRPVFLLPFLYPFHYEHQCSGSDTGAAGKRYLDATLIVRTMISLFPGCSTKFTWLPLAQILL